MTEIKDKKKERNNFLDAIKGFTIFLVVFGHNLQYGSGSKFLNEKLFFGNIVFKTIYSFHMPLFMTISGYFFYFTNSKRPLKYILTTRVTKVVLPVFAWTALFLIPTYFIGNNRSLEIFHEIKNYIIASLINFWFLWSVFYCSLIVVCISKLFNDSIFAYLLCFIITFFIDDQYTFIIPSYHNFMYPFFVVGYLYNKEYKKITEQKFFSNYYNQIMIGFVAFFIILVRFYKIGAFIYVGGYSIYHMKAPIQIEVDIYRMIAGFVGTIAVLMVLNFLYKFNNMSIMFKYFAMLGVDSLGIYIISFYCFNYVSGSTSNFSLNYGFTLLETIIVVAFCYLVTIILKRFKLTNDLFLGGRG